MVLNACADSRVCVCLCVWAHTGSLYLGSNIPHRRMIIISPLWRIIMRCDLSAPKYREKTTKELQHTKSKNVIRKLCMFSFWYVLIVRLFGLVLNYCFSCFSFGLNVVILPPPPPLFAKLCRERLFFSCF